MQSPHRREGNEELLNQSRLTRRIRLLLSRNSCTKIGCIVKAEEQRVQVGDGCNDLRPAWPPGLGGYVHRRM